MNTHGVGMKCYQKIMGLSCFMPRGNKNFTISFGVWAGGRIAMGNYGRFETDRVSE
jgi:hypothetical protein